MSERITLSDSPFDGAFVIREQGEAILPLYDRAEALYALTLARAWAREGRWISSAALESAVRVRFDGRN